MYRIGEFSILSKTTIKTLRYYEKMDLLKPKYVESFTGYRYYETNQLFQLAKIVSYRQMGLSISDIKEVLNGKDIKLVLKNHKTKLENDLDTLYYQLSQINTLLEGKEMKYEVIKKELPECIIYYKEGVIKSFKELTDFILSSGEECLKTNPNIKCVSPDYSYVNYLDGEYKEKDIHIRYAQAVLEEGIPNETIRFEKLKPVEAVCVYHKGDYNKLGEAYGFIMKWIEDNGYEVTENPRERYIDGIWNKENMEDWVTEIQVPVRKK